MDKDKTINLFPGVNLKFILNHNKETQVLQSRKRL